MTSLQMKPIRGLFCVGKKNEDKKEESGEEHSHSPQDQLRWIPLTNAANNVVATFGMAMWLKHHVPDDVKHISQYRY